MRIDGTLTTWDDERGFGFIEPSDGGEDVFVHVKSIPLRGQRPSVGMAMSFEVERGPKGKRRAVNVQLAPRHRSAEPSQSPALRSTRATDLFAIVLFAAVLAVVALLWRLPVWVVPYYVVASVLCFLAYAVDKLAAVRNARRISEELLHLIGVAGGWPGGLLAQFLLRHKSSKPSFKAAFWLTAALNTAGLTLFASPLGAKFFR